MFLSGFVMERQGQRNQWGFLNFHQGATILKMLRFWTTIFDGQAHFNTNFRIPQIRLIDIHQNNELISREDSPHVSWWILKAYDLAQQMICVWLFGNKTPETRLLLFPSCIPPISGLTVSFLIDIPIPAVNGTPKGWPLQTNLPSRIQKLSDIPKLI